MGGRRFEALDGMRGVCALIIVIYHCDIAINNGHLLNHGWLCVDMFFVLSGFVIAHVYEDRLQDQGGFVRFLRARAVRLLPVQLLGTLIVALAALALYLSGNLHRPGLDLAALTLATVYGMFLLPNSLSPVGGVFAYMNVQFPINPPLWSLLGEWVVNIIYGRWLHAMKTVELATIMAGIAAGMTYWALHAPLGWNAGTTPHGFWACMARAAIGFLLGVLIHRGHRAGYLKRLPAIMPEIVYAIWLFVCAIPTPYAMPIFEAISALLIAPLSIALLVRSERPLPGLYAFLGRISYSLYASHFAVVTLAPLWLDHTVAQHSALWALPMIPAAILLAWGVNLLTAMKYSGMSLPAKTTPSAISR